MAFLDRLFHRGPTHTPDLTPDEEAYKVQMWRQIETLVSPGLKDEPALIARLKDKALGEIEQYILYARTIGKTAQQLDEDRCAEMNRQLAARREILQNGYVLTHEDFKTTILPILIGMSFIPDPKARSWSGLEIGELLYTISDPDYYTSKEAQDDLLGLCDTMAVADVTKALRKQYETLRKAVLADVPLVRASAGRHACESCRALDGKDLEVAKLLDAFAAGKVAFPHELPGDNCAAWCNGPTLIAF